MMKKKAAVPTKRQKAQEQAELKQENKRLNSKAGKIQIGDTAARLVKSPQT